MSLSRYVSNGLKVACLIASATVLCGFTFRPGGPPELHFKDYNALPPRGNTVTVCHAHGCQKQEQFTFSNADISDVATLMDYIRTDDSAASERRAIAYAIAWMERRVGPATGTHRDRASLGFLNASGQLDCVDEATNATSYMMVLQKNGLMRHHFVIRPFSKAGFFKWPHFAAMMQERGSKTVYAVDSGVGRNGENPLIVPASQWYIKNGPTAPEPEPAPVFVRKDPAPVALAQSRTLDTLVEDILNEATEPQPGTLNYAAQRLR